MTAKVTSSASDSLGAIPTAGRQGARCGEVFSRSSVVTYSAVARVSRAASTGPPRLDVGFATPILDALLHLRIWLLGGRKLRPLGIGHLVPHASLLPASSLRDSVLSFSFRELHGRWQILQRCRSCPVAGLGRAGGSQQPAGPHQPHRQQQRAAGDQERVDEVAVGGVGATEGEQDHAEQQRIATPGTGDDPAAAPATPATAKVSSATPSTANAASSKASAIVSTVNRIAFTVPTGLWWVAIRPAAWWPPSRRTLPATHSSAPAGMAADPTRASTRSRPSRSRAKAASGTRHRKPMIAIPVSRRSCGRVVTNQLNQRCSSASSGALGLNAGGLARVMKRAVSPYQTAAMTKAAAPT